MRWRLITDTEHSAARHMAVDEALSLSVRKGTAPPTLRLYRWNGPAITIGYFQKIRHEVNLSYCRARGIEVVRRLTGGRAILHGPDEITYSFSAPYRKPFHKGLHASYVSLSQAFIAGLAHLGIAAEMNGSRRAVQRSDRNPVCFQSLSYAEVSVTGRKIIGSAQKRWPEGLIQQGSVPLTIPHDLLFDVLKFPSEAARESARLTAHGKMAGLRAFRPDLTLSEVEWALRRGLEEKLGVTLELGGLSSEERELQTTLYRDRYNASAWNDMR